LGIVVDLAHASHETVLGALKVATQPPIVSHTSLDSRTGGNPRMAEMMKPRLISKEQAKVVADAGGVVGVWTKLADSLKEFVESIKAMVDAVRITERALGTVHFGIEAKETSSRVFRRSLFVVQDVKGGERFTAENVRSIRPGYGLHTRHLPEVVGQRAACDIERGTPLRWDLVQRK